MALLTPSTPGVRHHRKLRDASGFGEPSAIRDQSQESIELAFVVFC